MTAVQVGTLNGASSGALAGLAKAASPSASARLPVDVLTPVAERAASA
jgi:hypothetical protein